MYPVSARWGPALRAPHTRVTTAVHRNLITGVSTLLSGRDGVLVDGSVTDDSTKRQRRSLSLTLAPSEAIWEALDTVGAEITVTQAIKYVDMQTEWVPMGIFVADQDQIGYGTDGNIQITAPDRWIKVVRNNFGLTRTSVPTNMAWQEIQRLVEACWAGDFPFPGWAQLDETATTKVGSLIWDDGNRDTAIADLCTANSLEIFFDRNGLAVLRPVPLLTDTSPSVWTVDASPVGVLIDASRTRDRSVVRNAILVTSTATDVSFAEVEVKNDTPGDPLSVDGPLGYVPEDLSLSTLRNSDQARAAGLTELGKTLGVAKQLTLTAAANPALDSEDVILALLPKTDANLPRPVELHMADSITHPLRPDGTQTILTRSTRPDTDGT